jgi:lysyl-tRNA synthetase class 2
MDWRPAATLETLQARAQLLRHTRNFFSARSVLEVETPLLCTSGITDPAIEPLKVESGRSIGGVRYLQTSPEYAMKRLLANGSGPIFQVSKAFRDGEAGSRHNPEFTLLEWYRPGFDHHQLMREVAELVLSYLGPQPGEYHAYRDLFRQELSIDPCIVGEAELESIARSELDVGDLSGDCDLWLDLLMSHVIEPRLADRGLCFVYDYPQSQAALARVSEVAGLPVGHRFELYVNGMELANGYWELCDVAEQRRRFIADNQRRIAAGLNEQPLDEQLLAALAAGLPDCAGVAVGLDRLLMLGSGCRDIRQVLAFDWSRS